MLKNKQIRISLIFFIFGIIIVSMMGIYYITSLSNINNLINNGTISSINQISNDLESLQNGAKILTVILIGIFTVTVVLLIMFIRDTVLNPITKLIKSAEHMIVEDKNKGQNKAEMDDLVNAFSAVTDELKENLNEISRKKNQMETILLHMTDGLVAFNMEGEVILINNAAKELLRISNEYNTFDKIFKKLNVDVNLEKIVYLENWTSFEQKIQVEDLYLNIFFASFKGENNRPSGAIAVIQDITEHVRLDNMRKEFVADVSHELKTPITSIMGYSETLLDGEYDKETETRFLNVILEEAQRMARLVSDLLTLSRLDNNRAGKEKSTFDLGDLVKEAQDKLKIELSKKNHKLESFVTSNVPPVFADKDGIERVFLNILSNSIKYTPNGGNIKIYVGCVYNDAYIKIIDNGIGIPEKDLNRIFERFYRVDKSRTREMGGTGLGLSIAKEILDKNGGSIDIKSEHEKGTEVVIKIPTVKEEINV